MMPVMCVEKKSQYFNTLEFKNVDCRHLPTSLAHSTRYCKNAFICPKSSSNIWYLQHRRARPFFRKWITFAQLTMPRSYMLGGEGLIPIAFSILVECSCLKVSDSKPEQARKKFSQRFLGSLDDFRFPTNKCKIFINAALDKNEFQQWTESPSIFGNNLDLRDTLA